MKITHLRMLPLAGWVILLLLLWQSISSAASINPSEKIPPVLQARLQGGVADYLVFFAGEVDLSATLTLSDKATKTRFVYDQLRTLAAQSQAEAQALLQREGAPFRQHYLLNVIEVRSDWRIAQKLASLTAVERLSGLESLRMALPMPEPAFQQFERLSSIEWGVNRVNAPAVWGQYSKRGEGVVVATADTGVQWDHPALKAHYRGWNGVTATHTYNWHDAIHAPASTICGADRVDPCDDNGHGTHVTGTMVGDDGAGNQIGVAPGAQWMGCRNMAQGDGTIARYVECFEFFLAPYPPGGNPLNDGRPDLAADIINNSWSCPPIEGCDAAHLNDMRQPIQRLEAAGILVVAAAGNAGSVCSTVNAPIAIYPEVFAVGATTSVDDIAGFSSRGPVTVDGSGRRKPDVAAPGVGVRSSYPPSSYSSLSGTSMASPHVSGVAALLWSVAPTMTGNITMTKLLLQNTATARTTTQGCGGDSTSMVPNNTYGYGIVNALSAIQSVPIGRRYYFPLFFK